MEGLQHTDYRVAVWTECTVKIEREKKRFDVKCDLNKYIKILRYILFLYFFSFFFKGDF